MTRLASLTTVRDTDVLRVAMSARARSSVTRTARRSSDAFPSASLSALSDWSTVSVSCVSIGASSGIEVQGGLVQRLVETDLAAAGQRDGRLDAPGLLGNRGAADAPGLERFDEGAEVVAHQIDHGPDERMAGVQLPRVAAHGVHRGFR